MGNPYSKLLNSPEIQNIKSKFSNDELETLSRIYTDLSARDYGVISKETFLQFFGLTGLWGERIFERFDLKHTENIGFAGFLSGLAAYCKCNQEEKIKLLFSLYDMDNDGFINRKELITMLYNFPKHYLREIIDDVAGDGGERMERFTEDKRQRTMTHIDLDDDGHFKAGSQNILASPMTTKKPIHPGTFEEVNASDLIIAEEETDDVLDRVQHRNLKVPRFNAKEEEPKPEYYLPVTSEKIESKDRAKPASLQSTQKQPTSTKGLEAPRVRSFGAKKLTIMEDGGKEPPSGSSYNRMSTIMLDQSYMISTTFNVRVKEYASIMFKGCGGAQRTGKICFDEFKTWLTAHKVLLKVFEGAFHQDLWMAGYFESKSSHSPLAETPKATAKESPLERMQTNRDVTISGVLYKKGKKSGSWKQRYYELKGPFLSYYTNPDKTCLKGVLFLEGCSITEVSGNPKGGKYGFCINNKSESYVPHILYCDGKAKYEEWIDKLKVFNSTSIYDFYQLQEEIGTGKFSTVYRGVSNKDKKEYAIKAVQKDKLQPSEKAAILSETSVMKMLDHPTTIKLIETIEVKNNLYIIMELVRDGDLFDYVISKEFLEESESSLIMKQLLVSVNYLHSVGIIHRDLKPENIMISKDSSEEDRVKEIKLIDFGFAKFLSSNTLMKDACGTPNYLAPEVIKGQGYDKKSDVFSLGIIMYFLLRGLLPFDSIDAGQVLVLTYKCEVPLGDEHWLNISPEAKDLLLKLLTKEPEQRIEIEEALKHPWIKNRENLKKYEGANKKTGEDQQ